MLTLGFLREYCQEIASPDSSGASSEREFMVWINSALSRVWTDADWHSIQRTRILETPDEVSGAGTIPPGGTLLTTLNPPWPTDLAGDSVTGDGPWEVVLDQQAGNTFFVTQVVGDDATLSHAFDPSAPSPNVTYYAFKNKLGFGSLDPVLAHHVPRQISLVWDTFQLREIRYLPPWRFEQVRGVNPTERSADPRFYTFRGNRLELWPHPGPSRQIRVTYLAAPPYLLGSDPDTLLIPWQDDTQPPTVLVPPGPTRDISGSLWADLLQKAIALEAAFTQGNKGPIPYKLAKVEYEDRLRKYKAADNNRITKTGPMNPVLPRPVIYPRDRSVSDFRAIPDAGIP